MGTAQRFIVVSLMVICGSTWQTSEELVPPFASHAIAAVIPAAATHASVSPVDDCAAIVLKVRPFWSYVWGVLLEHIRRMARWVAWDPFAAESAVPDRSQTAERSPIRV
jgi:hypothetical protein